MKNFKILLLFALGVIVSACSVDDPLTVITQDTVTRGAVLRTVSTEGAAWDVLDPSETITLELEEQDHVDGDLLSSVDVFADFIDNTTPGTTVTSETPLTSIPASAFSTGINGLPRTTFSTSLGELASTLGISFGEYNCGDQFNIRMVLNLTDGRSFTDVDATGNVSGGSFFSSPYNYRISLIAPLASDDTYTGQYMLTGITPGIYSAFDYADGIYTIETVNNTTKVIKDVTTFPAFGGGGPVDIEFQLVCGEIIVSPAQATGFACNASITSGPAIVNTTYDLANPDDSDFVINYTSDETEDCVPSVQASFRLTKI